jgi:putative peptide zinc metalloprotease protein
VSDSLFSPSWYRVAALRPRLREHVELHRHSYRGQIWYLLQDHATGRSHRFSVAAHAVIGLFDGRRTLDEIWDNAVELLGDDAPTQDEVLGLLAQLHNADALQSDLPPDSEELFRRAERQQRQKARARVRSPLAIRIPLWDPEHFLGRTMPFVAPLFTVAAFVLWGVLVTWGAVLAGQHWPDLTENLADRVLAPQNLFLLWLVYPAVKLLHELAHGYAIKRWGGEVHELGIMLLVFMPVPYVDASASTAFRPKHQRMVVAGVGIMVELLLAALALIAWVGMEPGIARTLAYNVMLIGGVSTLLFNGNPLLRFDGYYVLADALEIPNLAPRATAYLGYLFRRYLFGQREASDPARAAGERFWFVTYGLAAFVYRLFILCVIVLFVASQFFFVGVLLAAWALYAGVFTPVFQTFGKLLRDPGLNRRPERLRAGLAVAAVAILLLFLVPLPFRGSADGVLWVPEDAQVRAGTPGFVAAVLAASGTVVAEGDPIARLEDPILEARVAVLEARVRELELTVTAQFADRVAVSVSREELAAARLDLADARERRRALEIRAPHAGSLVIPDVTDLPGRWVQQGQLVAYVTRTPMATVRVTVPQTEIGLLRSRLREAQVAIADTRFQPLEARLSRFVPGGTEQLAHPALGTSGGGPIAVRPGDELGRETLERVFELDLELADAVPGFIGRRVHVRFDYGRAPLSLQLWRALRQLFLKRFGV